MEDLNMLAADCVVICCCCQCLILQILVFALLRLPAKLVKKTRDLAKRKLNRRRRSGEIVRIKEEEYCFRGDAEWERAFADDARRSCESCMEEVEKVMMGLHEMGELGFGSFSCRGRGGEGPWGSVPAINVSTEDRNAEEEKDDDDDDFVKHQIIEMVSSFSHT